MSPTPTPNSFPQTTACTRRKRGFRLALPLLLAGFLGACAGKNTSDNPGSDAGAEELKTEGHEVFKPAWSSNAAEPPKPGSIREIGSLPEGFAGFDVSIPDKPVKPAPPPPKAGPVDASASSWTIALGVFRGDNNFEEANQALARVRREGNLPSAYIQRRGPATVVAFGQYSGPTDPRVQEDLSRIQAIQLDGAPLYTSAYVCPPYTSHGGAQLREYDLRRARPLYGKTAEYTLQVGWYGREDLPRANEDELKEARKAAEEAAERLRREGELAFFFHGPNRSMVTVGVFDTSDFDPINHQGIESARLRDARRRHPLNLYNGAGYSYKQRGMRESKLLSSGLVRIPTK